MVTAAAAAKEKEGRHDDDAPAADSCDGRAQEDGLIVAYLDGELSPAEAEEFERHVAGCARCAGDLAEQRRVLCALSFALRERPDAALPGDFSQIVIARAQSDMRGVRGRGERRLALKICLGLTICAALLLAGAGAYAGGQQASPWRSAFGLWRPLAGVLSMIWRAASEAADGATVVLRAVGRQLLFDSPAAGVAVLLLFAAALALLPRLIINYHRDDARSAE